MAKKRSTTPDFSSIGQSLKRVKISTSPGELRLDRDIEGLLLGRQWTSTATNGAPIEIQNSWGHHGPRHCSPPPSFGRGHGELVRPDARLVRDPVDPLRLRLTCLHQPQSSGNNAATAARASTPLPPERWTFLIQMPRMYPHVPPAVTRVQREFVPNAENMNANVGGHHGSGHYSASAAMVASSVMQSHVEPPVPEQVLIQQLPPAPNLAPPNDHPPGGSKLLDIDLATAVFPAWSPVSSLQDLVEFLVALPARRREWWSVEGNRRQHREQQHVRGPYAVVGQPTMAPAMTTFTNSFQPQGHLPQQQPRAFYPHPKQQYQQQQMASTLCDMEDDGQANVVESMMEEAGAIPLERRVNPFSENRFDVGYDKGGNMFRGWGVR